MASLVLLATGAACSGEDSELGRALRDDEPVQGPTGAEEETVAPIDWEECEAARLLLYEAAATPDHETIPDPTLRSAWAELAATVPVELSAETESMADVVVRDLDDPDSVTARDLNLFISGLDRLTGWALETCPPDEPVWGCRERSTLRSDSSTYPSPELAAEGEGERVELARTDTEVSFGWLDAERYVHRRLLTTRTDGGWVAAEETRCDDLDARRSGGPLERPMTTTTNPGG